MPDPRNQGEKSQAWGSHRPRVNNPASCPQLLLLSTVGAPGRDTQGREERRPERWPASRTRRDNAGTCTPEVDATAASEGPSYRAPRNRKRRAPSLRGGASAGPAPSSQELPPARPPAQLQRVTRGARLRRPPWAGADCRGVRERRHGGGGVGGARAHAELRAAGAARLGQRAGGGAGLRGLRLG